jgi:hypothetical protein
MTLTHIKNLLNNRKLTPPIEDPEALTSNHLLLGQADVFDKDYVTARERWRVVQAISDQFWQRWMREVFPSLTKRDKWYQDQTNLEKGEIGLHHRPSQPSWDLANRTGDSSLCWNRQNCPLSSRPK